MERREDKRVWSSVIDHKHLFVPKAIIHYTRVCVFISCKHKVNPSFLSLKVLQGDVAAEEDDLESRRRKHAPQSLEKAKLDCIL